VISQWRDIPSNDEHLHIRLSERELRAMKQEQLAMLEDAVWLISQALKGRTDGPLTLPRSRLPVRAA
jgi:hypothetical protein